ncbi:allophanate hydrolase [Sphingomonas sp. PB4P5]|uniref:allophanate hydrolase n=1 Tax=Parasphingomonas puruogangriensis TaxID=3096155 RepID=UPI002FC93C11
MTDRLLQDAIVIAADVGAARVSALAVARETLARVEAYAAIQPEVWITRLPADTVLAMAAEVDARIAAGEHLPLAGVPFAIKDNVDLAGCPTTAGCPDFAYTPDASATVVARLIAAGAVPIGKTNLDQFATGLVGTRSPYGAPQCVFNRAYVSGGSSSGSAVAVAAGLVAFALGTDTAGSGRVPAAFNGLVGLKPSVGRWSSTGLVPACRTLDCITALTGTVADAALVDSVVAGIDLADDFSRAIADRPLGRRIGIPLEHQIDGDAETIAAFRVSVDAAIAAGCTIVPLDIQFLLDTAQLLYQGPWVAERTAAIEQLLIERPDAIDPVVREIVSGGLAVSGVETFRGIYALRHARRQAELMWQDVDALLLPTTPTIFRLTELRAAPIALNARLGRYTNFVNLLEMSALALPAGYRSNRTGIGVTFVAPDGADRALLDLGSDWLAKMPVRTTPPLNLEGTIMETVELAVVGAHLEGMPLHWQLTSRAAEFVRSAHTADSYRLYAMAGTVPPKPALVHDDSGAAIAVEIYRLDVAAFGSFVAEVPAPLAIGTVTLDDGTSVKGFVAEPRATVGARDITELGGWRAFVAEGAGGTV